MKDAVNLSTQRRFGQRFEDSPVEHRFGPPGAPKLSLEIAVEQDSLGRIVKDHHLGRAVVERDEQAGGSEAVHDDLLVAADETPSERRFEFEPNGHTVSPLIRGFDPQDTMHVIGHAQYRAVKRQYSSLQLLIVTLRDRRVFHSLTRAKGDHKATKVSLRGCVNPGSRKR